MKLIDLLEAKTARKYKLDADTREMLWYLIHSKTHVWADEYPDKKMRNVLAKYTTKTNKPLYRGFRSKEYLQKLAAGSPVEAMMSFSEDKSIAEQFGTVMTLEAPSAGFCYWDWVKSECDWLEKNDKFEFNSIDGDFIRNAAIEEAEWLMSHEMKLEVVDAEKFIFKQII